MKTDKSDSEARHFIAVRPGRRRQKRTSVWLTVSAAMLIITDCVSCAGYPSPAPAAQTSAPTPLLAYYYIWFDTSSWDRAKEDLPLLGRYSSDDAGVMQQHIRWAKAAGVRGFIVSWKSTDKLNRRLQQLIQVAAAEDFKLAIIYEGLDFNRHPLPVDQIAHDLDDFIARYAGNAVFDIFDHPLVIWSGTWEFSPEDVARVTDGRRDRLLILASEKNEQGYQRLAASVDGDAYYWSSVNPDSFAGYPTKLEAMGKAVHSHDGLWIAPAAPGFDARLVGGTSVVERKDGETLRRELDAAMRSSPDAVGLISWNEFSENSQVEPSQNYGRRYLDVLTDTQGGVIPLLDMDSSEPGTTQSAVGSSRIAALGMLAVLLLAGGGVIAWRARRGN